MRHGSFALLFVLMFASCGPAAPPPPNPERDAAQSLLATAKATAATQPKEAAEKIERWSQTRFAMFDGVASEELLREQAVLAFGFGASPELAALVEKDAPVLLVQRWFPRRPTSSSQTSSH